ncbi:MAG TPA: hypothetical protein VHC19_11320 [Pirellulales bacterium]|nr:hypothetical protein [Pirellulales bacterium]
MLIGMGNHRDRLILLLKPTRRWAQFSLGTMWALITALCLTLGMWIVPAEKQRRAVAAIEALDVELRYSDPDPESSETFPVNVLRRWLPRAYFDSVQGVTFSPDSGSESTDDGLAHLQQLNGLRDLFLESTDVTDAGLRRLQDLPHLRSLDLSQTRVTDAGLAYLKPLKELQELWLDGVAITDEGLIRLRALTGLRDLFLAGAPVTRAGLERLRHALPACRIHAVDVGGAAASPRS